MFRIWDATIPRPTRDLDFLGTKTNDMSELARIMSSACTVTFEEDGMVYDQATVKAEKITKDADYEGVRIKLEGKLGTAKTMLQVDIGFGDIVVPKPIVIEYPTLLDLPAPKLKTYTMESVIAEKLHAMIFLGTMNSRMKDFYDLWFLASQFDFEGKTLSKAVKKTFERRKTDIDPDPITFQPAFAVNPQKQAQWAAFYRKLNALESEKKETGLQDALAIIRVFVLPILLSLHEQKPFTSKWDHSLVKWME